MVRMVKTSLNIDTTPSVNNSLSASTSLVLCAISRPNGVRSKNFSGKRCKCEKICARTSRIAHCPTILVAQLWA